MTEYNSGLANNSENAQNKEISIQSFIDVLGLERTPELHEAADILVAVLKDVSDPDADRTQAWQEYSTIAEDSVERSVDYGRAQIAAIIHKAGIFKAANDPLRYVSELDGAQTYAFNAGLNNVAQALADEIETVGDTLEPSPELLVVRLSGLIVEQNREYLRDLIDDGATLDDLVGDAYGMIIEAGGDPDETLRRIGMIE